MKLLGRALGAILGAWLIGLALGIDLPGSLQVTTGASMALWGVAAAMERLPLVGATSDVGIVLESLLVAGLAVFGIGRVRQLGHLFALPALVGILALLLFAAGLGEGLAAAAVLLASYPLLGGEVVEREDRRTLFGGLFVGWAALLSLHALYASGPGIQPAAVADGGLWGLVQDLLSALPGGLGPVLSALGIVAGVAAARGLGKLGVPRWPRLDRGPEHWLMAGAHLSIVALLGASGPWLSGVWRCPEPPSFVTPFDDEPGTFQLAVVGDQLWANDREGRSTRRFSLPDGSPLPSIAWEDHLEDAWPEELIPVGEGAWIALVAGEEDGNVVVPVAADGAPGAPFRLPGCFIASSAALGEGDVLLGCEYAPDFVRLGADGSKKDRFTVPGLGSVEELIVVQDRAYAVALWGAPWLTAIDLGAKKAARSVFAGDFNWDLAWAPGEDLLAVPRFLERRIDLYDRATLAPKGSLAGEFGGRPLVFDARRRTFYVAGTFSGRLRASSLDGSTKSLPVGGLVRSMALRGDTLYLGGRCGVRAVDLQGWEAS